MEKSKSEHSNATFLSDPVYKSPLTALVGEHVQPSSIGQKSTVICYGDISIDYSQYYKEAPITFEDLLSDDEGSVSSSSSSDEGDNGFRGVGSHMIVQQSSARINHEEGSGLR